MKKKLEKAFPVILIITVLISCFAFSVSAAAGDPSQVTLTQGSSGYYSLSGFDAFYVNYDGYSNMHPYYGGNYRDMPLYANVTSDMDPMPDEVVEGTGVWGRGYLNEGGYIEVPSGGTIHIIFNWLVQTDGSQWGLPFCFTNMHLLDYGFVWDFEMELSESGKSVFATIQWTNNTGKSLCIDFFSAGLTRWLEYLGGNKLLSFSTLKYRVYSESEMNSADIQNKIDAATDELSKEMAEQTDKVLDEIQSSTDEITGEIQDSTDQITGSVGDAANQIGGSIEDSTDKITGGWNSSPESPSGSSSVGDYSSVEQQALDSSAAGLSQGEGLVNNLSTHLGKFTNGFIFISGMVNNLLGVGWIPALVQISLALGIVAFFLNLAPTILNKIGSNKNNKNSGGKKGGGG